jgi:antitoxin (DNA-binding transcriptional repressor) of toxin-antitoxin stability system
MKAVRTVSATEFKQHCHALHEGVRQTRQSVLVTHHGKPVAEISACIPPERDSTNPLKGSILNQGDLVAPIEENWSE